MKNTNSACATWHSPAPYLVNYAVDFVLTVATFMASEMVQYIAANALIHLFEPASQPLVKDTDAQVFVAAKVYTKLARYRTQLKRCSMVPDR